MRETRRKATTMKLAITTGLTVLTIMVAAPVASADNTSWGSWGNDTLGGSVGPNGFTSTVLGQTTSVDGINTFTGSFSIVNPRLGTDFGITEKYSLSGIDSQGHFTTPTSTFSADGEIYYTGRGEATYTLNGSSVSVVCDPICRAE